MSSLPAEVHKAKAELKNLPLEDIRVPAEDEPPTATFQIDEHVMVMTQNEPSRVYKIDGGKLVPLSDEEECEFTKDWCKPALFAYAADVEGMSHPLTQFYTHAPIDTLTADDYMKPFDAWHKPMSPVAYDKFGSVPVGASEFSGRHVPGLDTQPVNPAERQGFAPFEYEERN